MPKWGLTASCSEKSMGTVFFKLINKENTDYGF